MELRAGSWPARNGSATASQSRAATSRELSNYQRAVLRELSAIGVQPSAGRGGNGLNVRRQGVQSRELGVQNNSEPRFYVRSPCSTLPASPRPPTAHGTFVCSKRRRRFNDHFWTLREG